MTKIEALLGQLANKNITIWSDGEQLYCKGPAGAVTPQLGSLLKEYKMELIHLLSQSGILEKEVGTHLRNPACPEFEVSYYQEMLLSYISRMKGREKKSPNVYSAFTLCGALDMNAIKKSINEIIKRHETLRTSFIAKRNQWQQRVNPFNSLKIPFIDYSLLPHVQQMDAVVSFLTKSFHHPFDLESSPLIGAAVIRLQPEEHVLGFWVNHIAFDGFSHHIFMKEFSVLYDTFSKNGVSPLPDLTVQYSDFSVWQRQQLAGLPGRRMLNYWRKQLKGCDFDLGLPTDYARRKGAVPIHRSIEQPIAESDFHSIVKMSQQLGCTLPSFFLSAFMVLLSKITCKWDIYVFTMFAGRTFPKIEPLIGYFANPLVLRTQLEPQYSLKETLSKITRANAEAISHLLPVDVILMDLELRTKSKALFNYRMLSTHVSKIGALAIKPFPIKLETGTSAYDLILDIYRTPDGQVVLELEYNQKLFKQSTVQRFLADYYQILSLMITTPEKKLTQVLA